MNVAHGSQGHSLIRWKADSAHLYTFNFDVPRGPEVPAFSTARIGTGTDGSESTQYYIFGVTKINTQGAPLRWDLANQVLFCTRDVTDTSPPPGGIVLERYPLIALVEGDDDGRWPLDPSKVPDRFNENDGFPAPNYVGCGPIAQALQGLHHGWKQASNPGSGPAKVVHYDIRAIDEAQVELYMTADGELSKWLFDGKTWKNVKHYDLQIEGEFLVFDDGRALVSEADGQWSMIADIEEDDPVLLGITACVEGEPLTLVEDKVERSNFFLHRDKVLDERGRELLTLRDGRDHRERVLRVIKFVVDRRRR